MGMSKEDRELQSAKIMNYEPNEREIVYFEDPLAELNLKEEMMFFKFFFLY